MKANHDDWVPPSRRQLLACIAGAGLSLPAGRSVRALAREMVRGAKIKNRVTTLKLINVQGLTVRAGAPVKPFALQFCKGDIAPGTYPKLEFASDNSNWPCTFRLPRSWSDGSMKHVGVVPACCPKIIPPEGITVNVMSRGPSGGPSGRSDTDFYAAQFQVNLTGRGMEFGLDGFWTSRIDDTEATFKKISYGDGPGGMSKRFDSKVTQHESDHRQLRVRHYVDAVNDIHGNLAGFWWLPRVWQPYYDIDMPPKKWRALSAFTLQSKGPRGLGISTYTPPFPYDVRKFTWSSGNEFVLDAAHNWWTGGGQGGDSNGFRNVVPVVFTTTGILPSGLSSAEVYFASIAQGMSAGKVEFTLWRDSGGQHTRATAFSTGLGVHTIIPTRLILHFGTQFGATAEGEWQWVQAQGSEANPGPIQVNFDNAYRKKTRCFPPYDFRIPAISNPMKQNGFTFGWTPLSIGPLSPFLGGGGDREDIGILCAWQVRHFYNQSKTDETFARILGLAEAHQGACFRDSVTFMPPVINNTSYDGLPAADPNGPIYTRPPAPNGALGIGGGSGSVSDHKACVAPYAYLCFGSPEFLDLMLESCLGGLLSMAPVNRNHTKGNSFDATGIAASDLVTGTAVASGAGIDGPRTLAWMTRDVITAAGLWPDVDPDDTDLGAYLEDLRRTACAFPVLWLTAQPAYNRNVGFWSPAGTLGHDTWMINYAGYTFAWAACLCEDGDAQKMVNNFAKWLTHVTTTWGPWHHYAYSGINAVNGYRWNGTYLPDDAHYGVILEGPASLSWSSVTGLFTWNSIRPGSGFASLDGNKIIFPTFDRNNGSTTPPDGLANDTPYYQVRTAGNTFMLSSTLGGPPTIPRNSGSLHVGDPGKVNGICAAPTSTGIPLGAAGPGGYLAEVYGLVGWLTAQGAKTSLTATRNDAKFRLIYNQINLARNPKWAMDTSYE